MRPPRGGRIHRSRWRARCGRGTAGRRPPSRPLIVRALGSEASRSRAAASRRRVRRRHGAGSSPSARDPSAVRRVGSSGAARRACWAESQRPLALPVGRRRVAARSASRGMRSPRRSRRPPPRPAGRRRPSVLLGRLRLGAAPCSVYATDASSAVCARPRRRQWGDSPPGPRTLSLVPGAPLLGGKRGAGCPRGAPGDGDGEVHERHPRDGSPIDLVTGLVLTRLNRGGLRAIGCDVETQAFF